MKTGLIVLLNLGNLNMPKVTWEELLEYDCDAGLDENQDCHEVKYMHTEGYSLMHKPFKKLKKMMGE